MTYREPARRTARRISTILVAGLLVVVAAIATSLGYPVLSTASSSPPASPSPPASSSWSSASRIPVHRSGPPGALGEADGVVPDGAMVLRPGQRGALGEADGVLPDGTTVLDDEFPGVANLDPALLGALRRAATDAAGDEVEMFVTSGWRSRTYQEQLFRQAVSKYGSTEKAALWVATPGTSAHESGNAVDIGSFDAMAWLSKHGAEYGLCQIYRNEPWHYELRPGAINHGCPRMDADPTHDSGMQH
jgi:zinc D-Ala-D-Ala carboxypeptidase